MISILKKGILVLVSIILLNGCEQDVEISPKSVIGLDKLTENISSNEQFKLFAKKHYENLSLLGSLSGNELEIFKSKASSLLEMKKSGDIIVLLNEYNFNSQALTHFVNLRGYLDEKFRYSQDDFNNALIISCERFATSVKNSNGRTTFELPWMNLCQVFCVAQSEKYADSWRSNGFDQAASGAMGNAYMVGCFAGCNFE